MITIVNYGLGNINAFANVYRYHNIKVNIAATKEELGEAEKIILPGVGSFDQAMQMLQQSGMRETLDELVLKKKVPVLGICVGMQMLAGSSEEGSLPGLSWIKGSVLKFRADSRSWLPHMGWNTVEKACENMLLSGMEEEQRFYFLHSYYFSCDISTDIISYTNYGIRFASAINHENIFGVQFHPEKSHANGIKLLSNFAKI